VSSRRWILVVPLAGIACVLACDVVIGINGYDKCDACAGDAGEAGAADVVVVDVVDDGFQLPDGVSEATSWAQWPIENTPLEVEAGAPDATLTNITGTGPFTDTITGLHWYQTLGLAQTIEDATSYCAGLQPPGTWRVPTRIELVTLLDSTVSQSPYVTPALAGTIKKEPLLWTSSYLRPMTQPLKFWFLSAQSGDVTSGDATLAGVLCVN
jgi:hypothetical protein